jgi:peptidoglycan/LPS O-acetylase OafA/YrhL
MIGLGALVVLLRFNDSAQGLGILAAEVCAAVLVIGRKPEWLGTPLLAYLGKLSYGIYLWHYPIVWIMRETHQPWPVTAGVSLLASIALAAISYHSIESWFRASKRTLVGAQASTA